MNERDLEEYYRLLETGSVRYGLLYNSGSESGSDANLNNASGTARRRFVMQNDPPGATDSTSSVVSASGISGKPLGTSSSNVIYNSFAGVDIVASLMLPGHSPMILGELSTISYSIHRENVPLRAIGHVSPLGFTKGPRTIAGSMIFTVFNEYAFYRLQEWSAVLGQGLYPLADMLPPFDIVISFANEYGAASKMRIQGISIIDEGQTMSIEDLVTEQTYQYMARAITPLVRQRVRVSGQDISGTQKNKPIQP